MVQGGQGGHMEVNRFAKAPGECLFFTSAPTARTHSCTSRSLVPLVSITGTCAMPFVALFHVVVVLMSLPLLCAAAEDDEYVHSRFV